MPEKGDDPLPEEYLKESRHPMGRRDILRQLAGGLAVLTVVAGVTRQGQQKPLAIQGARKVLLSLENKKNLLAMAEGNFPMDDPLLRLDNFLPQLKITHPDPTNLTDPEQIRAYEPPDVYEDADMQWLAPILHRAVECGNRPMIRAIVEAYPSYLTGVTMVSARNRYNLTEDINLHYSPAAASVLIDSLKAPQAAYYR